MIIKKIIDICKAANTLYVYEDGKGVQWLSDGSAIYPLHGIPRFEDADEICRTFDISEKKKDKMCFRWNGTMPSGLDFSDYSQKEEICNRAPVDLRDGTIPFFGAEKMLFMQAKYIGPIMDAEEGMLEVYERRNEAGKNYFAVKSGLMLKAIIMPYNALDEMTVKNIEIMAKRCRDEIGQNIKEVEDEPQEALDYGTF